MNKKAVLHSRPSKPLCQRLILPALIALCVSPPLLAQAPADMLQGLTEAQRFKAYPRVDMAYRLVAQERIADAIKEIEHARERIPTYLPLAQYHANLLLRDQRFLRAAAVASAFPGNAQMLALKNEAYEKYAQRDTTTADDMIALTNKLPEVARDQLIRIYTFNHQQLSARQLRSLYMAVPPAQVSTETSALFNNLLVQRDAPATVAEVQRQICAARVCTYDEWRALALAQISLQRFTQLRRTLEQTPQPVRSELFNDVIERMIGAAYYQPLLEIMQPWVNQDALSLQQARRLYLLDQEINARVAPAPAEAQTQELAQQPPASVAQPQPEVAQPDLRSESRNTGQMPTASVVESRNDTTKAELAFSLISQNQLKQADAVIRSISDWQSRWLFVGTRLDIAQKLGDVATQRQLLALADKFEDHAGEVAIRKAYFLYEQNDFAAASSEFSRAFTLNPATKTPANLEQAAYAGLFNNQQSVATDWLEQSLDQRLQHHRTTADEAIARAQQLHRQVDSPWNVTVAGWFGDSSNVSVVTANDFQSDYFFNAEVTYDLNYDSNLFTDLNLGLATLSGGESNVFDNNELDFHLAWKPWVSQQAIVRVGVRHNLETSQSRNYLRASYDPLKSLAEQKSWSSDHQWFAQSLFLDAIYYIDSGTYGSYARYTPSYEFWGENSLFYSGSVYPFIQYQRTNDTATKDRLSDTRWGLGYTYRSSWLKSRYNGHTVFLETSIEWQYVVSSDFSEEQDNAFLLRFALYY